MPEIQPVYSGDLSVKFWERINALERGTKRDFLYSLGCELQNLEGELLKQLHAAEREATAKKKKKAPRKRPT